MTRYRRPYSYDNYGPTRVTIHWSQKHGAYAIKFGDLKHYNELQIVMLTMKSQPYGEYQYDPDEKIWYLMEKHIDKILTIFKQFKEHPNTASYFDVDYQEKPIGQTNTATFVPIDVYLDRFKELTGHDLRTIKEYTEAKKLYRRSALANHPDRNGGDGSKMSAINEAWGQIEELHYHIKKETEYENAC